MYAFYGLSISGLVLGVNVAAPHAMFNPSFFGPEASFNDALENILWGPTDMRQYLISTGRYVTILLLYFVHLAKIISTARCTLINSEVRLYQVHPSFRSPLWLLPSPPPRDLLRVHPIKDPPHPVFRQPHFQKFRFLRSSKKMSSSSSFAPLNQGVLRRRTFFMRLLMVSRHYWI